MFGSKVVNTDHVATVEVSVTPFHKDIRTFINGVAGITAMSATLILALQGLLQGYAWFAPLLASINTLNLVFGYLSKRGVESKNIRAELAPK